MSHTKDTVGHQLADLVLHRFDLGRVQRSGGQTEIGQLDVTGRVDQKVLRKGSSRQPSCSIRQSTAGERDRLPLVSSLDGCNRVCATRSLP